LTICIFYEIIAVKFTVLRGVYMKKLSYLLAMLAVALAFTLALTGCSGDGSEFDEEFNVTAADFDSTFKSIRNTPGNYLITLSGNLLEYPGAWMDTEGVNITVRGTGANRITWKADETDMIPLFGVVAGKLTLEDITLARAASSDPGWPMISIYGGAVEIKKGVAITNNNGTYYYEGVYIEDSGSVFTMSGGSIENCRSGVLALADRCTINISGGEISRNENGIYMGGSGITVTISNGRIINSSVAGIYYNSNSSASSVIMKGGEISGVNGVQIRGTNNAFTISGGRITGTENCIQVRHGSGHTITKTGGTVTGGQGAIAFVNVTEEAATVTGF
jgi:hypothetical protein